METDADRLYSIQDAGGLCVRSPNGEFWAIFDDNQTEVIGAPGVNVRQLALTCRLSDVSRLAVTRDTLIEIPTEDGSVQTYRAKNDPDRNNPAPGWAVIQLKR